jgi:hypothetical protein
MGIAVAMKTNHSEIVDRVVGRIFVDVMNLHLVLLEAAYTAGPIRGKHDLGGLLGN